MDRKGWIILTACGILLAANFFLMPKKPAPEPKAPATESVESSDTSETPEATTGELVHEPSIPKVGEKTATLTSSKDGENYVEFNFSSVGGGVASAKMLKEMEVGSKTEHVILNKNAPAPIGALTEGPDEFLAPNYVMVEKDGMIFCQHTTPAGLEITKRWSLEEDEEDPRPGAQWRLVLSMKLANKGKGSVNLGNYSIFAGSSTPLHPRELEAQGGVFYLDDGSYNTLAGTRDGKLDRGFFHRAQITPQESVEELEYAGVSNQFFATVIQPKQKYASTFWAKASPAEVNGADPEKPKHAIRSGFTLPANKLAAGETETFYYSIFIGPKHYSELKKFEGDVDEIMNYGWFSFISVFLNNVMNWLHDIAFSKVAHTWAWGLSIIALTIFIRIVIWPLHHKSTRTMKRMSKLQPMMKEIREKYADEPTKLNQETMKIYKDYKINPMGGCLPMLLQIPIFFGYYKMLQFAVELRGQEFLWVDDLSMPDTLYTINLPFDLPFLGDALPVNLLPILMAVTMVLQMKMTPKTGDKMQQRIFMLMPLMFFFFCYNFASALALYWTTQNIFSIGQTWLTNRLPDVELQKRKPSKKGKKTFMERMSERLEEQRLNQEAGQSGKSKQQPMRDATPDKKKKRNNPKTGG